MIIWGYITIFTYVFILLFGLGPLIKNKYNIESSRKFIHTALFVLWILIDVFLKNTIHQVIIPVVFLILNALSFKYKIFKSIEREENDSLGTIYFALVITILMTIVLIRPELFNYSGIAIFSLTFGDGFAALIGYNTKSKKIYKNKSLYGTIACFIATAVSITILQFVYNMGLSYGFILLIALTTTLLELIGGKLDNILVTFGVFALCCIFNLIIVKSFWAVIGIVEIIMFVFLCKRNNKPNIKIS